MSDAQVPDDDMVIRLRDAYEADLGDVPADLSRFAIDALQWRVVDDELAVITFDSSANELAGVRGSAGQRRSITFNGRGLTISVSMSAASVVASIDPPGSYAVSIEGYETDIELRSDDSGQVAVSDYPVPLRFVVDAGNGRLVSPWLIA